MRLHDLACTHHANGGEEPAGRDRRRTAAEPLAVPREVDVHASELVSLAAGRTVV